MHKETKQIGAEGWRTGETRIHEDRAALIRTPHSPYKWEEGEGLFLRARSGLWHAYRAITEPSRGIFTIYERLSRSWGLKDVSSGASMFGTISSRCGPSRHDREAMCLSSVFFFYERHLHVTKYHINSYSELNLNPSIRPLWNDSYLPTYVGKYLHGNIMLAR